MTRLERFQEYHRRHPEIYEKWRELAREAKLAGRTRYSARAIGEVLRWNTTVRGSGTFKVPDLLWPYYARLLEREDPSFQGFFLHHKEIDIDDTQTERTTHDPASRPETCHRGTRGILRLPI